MNTEFIPNDRATAQEMLSLVEAVDFGPHRSFERNQAAPAGSIFIASTRQNSDLIGLIRLVGDFARENRIGTGENLGEFILFANVDADVFYEKLGFIPAPNGMVLTDTKARRKWELEFQREWTRKRKGDNNRCT